MRKLVYGFAILAAAASTAAVAKDLKQDQKAAPTVKATIMSDAEMDKISAGSAPKEGQVGFGKSTAHYYATGDYTHGFLNGFSHANPAPTPGGCVGFGTGTGGAFGNGGLLLNNRLLL